MKNKKVKKMEWMRGFTLVELLVVISIIAVLLSVMMPALSKAREGARSTVCKTNLKQITLAASLWSEEHGGYVVPSFWYSPSKPYNDGTQESIYIEQTIARGGSIEKYTGTNQKQKNNLYCCPTATKFGESLFALSSGIFYKDNKKVDRTAGASYGVNGLAVTYDEDQWLGAKGINAIDDKSCEYSTWGPANTYAYEHGKAKVMEIPTPSRKVYFSDFSFPVIYAEDSMKMYHAIKVVCRTGNNSTSVGAYAYYDTLAAAGSDISNLVQSRWHGAINAKTGYGYGNIAWFDGSASKEPPNFDDPTKLRRVSSDIHRYRWHEYFQQNARQ
ncbi:MAG: prepilin-type N-terminal cleavage/methylation domain-containing protein [Phycisphaerales bacterium]